MIFRLLAVLGETAGIVLLSACTAHADPVSYPDMTGYTPVVAAEYRIDTTSPGHASSATYFLTPDGITCNFRSGGAQCTGNNFPAVPPAALRASGSTRYAVAHRAPGSGAVPESPPARAPIRHSRTSVLPPPVADSPIWSNV